MSYDIDLAGRVALVTGASGGLGTQFAKTLASAGATVVLAGRRMERLRSVRGEIEEAGGDAHVVALDINDQASIRSAMAQAETEVGAIDILVNAANVGRARLLTEVTGEDYDHLFDINTRGAFFLAQEVGRRMIARAEAAAPGTFTGGRIVNVVVTGLQPPGRLGVHAMSRSAVVRMTRAMALEWGRFGINVNAISAGSVDIGTDDVRREGASGRAPVTALPHRRVGRPEDLDVVLMMLCSNQSHFINGAVIQADDGFAA